MGKPDSLYPLVCQPLLKEKIWGGRKLEKLFGMSLPDGKKIGEAWLVADLKEGTSSIRNGEYAGKTLSQVSKEWGERLIGTSWKNAPTGGRFPLLIKFLDAQEDLSIQVHPDSESCNKYFPNDFSKDESWIILQSDPHGKILHGIKPEITLSDFDGLVAKGKVEEGIRSVNVSPGDVFRVAPGTVHALCSGVSILEVQEPSDTTFRIFDYNRMGNDGKPRALHIEESRKVVRFGDNTLPRIIPQLTKTQWGTHELLVNVPAYRIERITLLKSTFWEINPASVQVLIVLEGNLEIVGNGEIVTLKSGNCVILPSALGNVDVLPKSEKVVAVLAGAGNVPMVQ